VQQPGGLGLRKKIWGEGKKIEEYERSWEGGKGCTTVAKKRGLERGRVLQREDDRLKGHAKRK
jgi:hypothetical protein